MDNKEREKSELELIREILKSNKRQEIKEDEINNTEGQKPIGENFTRWLDLNRESLEDRHKRELRNGDTKLSFGDWVDLEFRIGAVKLKVSTIKEQS